MSDWLRVRLGDHTELLTGFPFTSINYSTDETAIRLLRGDNIAQGRLRWDGVKRWPEELEDEYRDYRLKPGDVVVAMDRPWIEAGLKFAAVKNADVPSLLVQRVARLRATQGLDQRFLRCVVGSRGFTDHILSVQTGTAVPHISPTQISDFRFALPPLSEQIAIAEVFGALDDKIELNDQVVQLNVSLAQADFHRRFATRDLGLQITQIGEVTDCLHTKKPEKTEQGRSLLQLSNIRDDGLLDTSNHFPISEADYSMWTSKIEAREGDVVITNVGRVGAVARIPKGFHGALGRNMTAVRSRTVSDGVFCALALNDPCVRRGIQTLIDSGTLMDALNVHAIRRIMLPSAERVERASFSETAEPLLEFADALLHESKVLAELRDALLPRLVSGELRIRDVETSMVEAL